MKGMSDQEAFYPARNLYSVHCRRKGADLNDYSPETCKQAFVVAASIESASLKAIARFNGEGGSGEFEVTGVDLRASGDSKDNIFIE